MPKPRHCQVSLEATPYYHCVSRCVRRAHLCGNDTTSNRSFDHRRQWIEDKLHQLATIFAIELCAYAVMSNHYHVVLHVDVAQANCWERDEVIRRWHCLFCGNVLSQRYLRREQLNAAELSDLDKTVYNWRERLMNISWFMRIVNEHVARRANSEDQVTGRFWEGRFKSQALLDEAALLTCLAYVDLNPIRAKMTQTLENSNHTSIKQRIDEATRAASPDHPKQQPAALFPFVGYLRRDSPKGLPFRLTDYLDLVDWTGRILREDKRGVIDDKLPPILVRLNLEPKHWYFLTRHFESPFKSLVGCQYKLKRICALLGYQRTPGIGNCRVFFP